MKHMNQNLNPLRKDDKHCTHLRKAYFSSHNILLIQSLAAFHLIPRPVLVSYVFCVEPHIYSFLLSTILEIFIKPQLWSLNICPRVNVSYPKQRRKAFLKTRHRILMLIRNVPLVRREAYSDDFSVSPCNQVPQFWLSL
jgi:hypothetical protein